MISGGRIAQEVSTFFSLPTLYLMPFALMISFATAKAGVAAPCSVSEVFRGQD